MANVPTVQLVVVDGRPVHEVCGYGVTVRHPQLEQAQISWFLKAAAAGYDGPAPVIAVAPMPDRQ